MIKGALTLCLFEEKWTPWKSLFLKDRNAGGITHKLGQSLCTPSPSAPPPPSAVSFADEREAVQKKTFTKWVNSHLGRVTCRIGDLYTDLRDGRMLIRLLEVLSGEQLVSISHKNTHFCPHPQRYPPIC